MSFTLCVVAGNIRRCLRIHVNEAIASRYLSDRRRKAAPSFQKLSDVIHERMKETDRREESVRLGSEERLAGSGIVQEEATAMNTTMNKMQETSVESASNTDANHCAENVTQEEWLTIYRFNRMLAIRFFCRFKIVQAASTVVTGVMALISHALGWVATDSLVAVLVVSTFATCSMYVVGNILRHVIGFAYLSQDQKRVRIAHIDFWGWRRDHVLSVNHIVPLRDSQSAFFARQLFISDPNFSDRYYTLILKEATFTNPQLFADIFDIDVEEITKHMTQTPETKEKVDESGK